MHGRPKDIFPGVHNKIKKQKVHTNIVYCLPTTKMQELYGIYFLLLNQNQNIFRHSIANLITMS